MPTQPDISTHRGRPKVNPEFSKEEEVNSLLQKAVDLYRIPFDDREIRDQDAPTLEFVAEAMDTSVVRVRKLLITAKMYSTELSRRVQMLDKTGHCIEEIMKLTGLKKASVYNYLPYKNGAYNLSNASLYSQQAKRYRSRKTAVENLQKALSSTLPLIDTGNSADNPILWSLLLWKAVIAFAGFPFSTSGRGSNTGVKFTYTVPEVRNESRRKYSGENVTGYGNEMKISNHENTISRSTVDLAFSNALKVQSAEGCVKGPKKLGVPGAGSYLYPLFLRFGVIKKER